MVARHAQIAPERLLGFSLPAREAGGLAPLELKRLLTELKAGRADWSLLAPHVAFDPQGYVRKRLFRNREWEVLLLCWLPGQKTVVHDHGGSWGATLMIAGEMNESLFRWQGEGRPMRLAESRDIGLKRVTVETTATVHRVENRSTAPALSLHIYSPPLRMLHSYDPETGNRHPVRLDEGPSVAVGGKPRAIGARRKLLR